MKSLFGNGAWLGLLCAFVVLALSTNYVSSLAPPSSRSLDSNWVPIVIGLKERNIDFLSDKLLNEVANPHSVNYGKFMTLEEISAITAPDDEDINEVLELLTNTYGDVVADVQLVQPGKNYIRAYLKVGDRDVQRNDLNPYSINEFIDLSHPLIEFISPLRPTNPELSFLDWSIAQHPVHLLVDDAPSPPQNNPPYQKTAYEMPPKIRGAANTTQMVWGTGTYGVLLSDLKSFYESFNIDEPLDLISIVNNQKDPNGANFGEASLDTQYITAMAEGIFTYVVNSNSTPSTESGAGFGPAFLDFVVTLSSSQEVPDVLSISLGSLSWVSCDRLCTNVSAAGVSSYEECLSYAQSQFQVCMYTSANQTEKISNEFMKLGLRGTSIFAASGDGGCHWSFGPFSEVNSIGRALNKFSCEQSMPTFPAESPYVVAVGGSQMLSTSKNATLHPVFCSAQTGGVVSGGGGFSWQFSVPSYQQSAVSSYLQSNSPSFQFNANGRGYPDVSTLATDVPIVIGGYEQSSGGTSASTPEFAAIISLINNIRVQNNKTVLGFITPALYEITSTTAFYDITEGNSKCGYSDGPISCCNEGFEATPGWDAVTGLGQPRWAGLFNYLYSL